ncbi:MAG: hypothetical protein R3E91_05305 [Chlamydiales bacterium]
MCIVKNLGLIFLAVYLFFSGLFQVTSMVMPMMGNVLIGLVGMASGILLLISLGGKKDKHCS